MVRYFCKYLPEQGHIAFLQYVTHTGDRLSITNPDRTLFYIEVL
jgi:hypothetical protein